jgi:hypothetical protein
MVIRDKEEEAMSGSIDVVIKISSRIIRLGSFVTASTRIHELVRYRHVGARDRTPSSVHCARLWAERYWPVGRVVLQLSAAAAMITQKESVALAINGIAMLAEIAQDRTRPAAPPRPGDSP